MEHLVQSFFTFTSRANKHKHKRMLFFLTLQNPLMLLPIVIDLCVLQANLDCLIKIGSHLLYIKTLITSRNCKNNPDLFCFMRGKFTPMSKRRTISDFVKEISIKHKRLKEKLNPQIFVER